MIQTQHHHIQIYKNLVLVISAFIIFGSTYTQTKAAEFGEIQYNNTFIDYSKIDINSTRKLADFYFDKAMNEMDSKLKQNYLQKASGEYFILSQAEPKDLYPIVQLARVYDLENKNQFAKAYFFRP